jgi:HSP20 family protein
LTYRIAGAVGVCLASEHKEEQQMALLLDPLDALASFQQALDAYRTSSWLDPGLSGGGAYPPVNVFRKGDDFIIIAELPGVQKSDLDVQVKGRTVRLAGKRTVSYPEKAALHRRERLAGRFDRAVTMPIEINPDSVKAEYRDGILALFLPRAEGDKPKSIKVA